MKYLRLILSLMLACAAVRAGPESAVSEVGHVHAKSLNEASGLVMSRNHPGVYWTHNDGDDGVLYAIAGDGSTLGKIKVDAKFRDWEDIAGDADGNLYLADVGNNSRDRKHITVYRLPEPDPQSPRKASVAATWKLTFPDHPFNCESLFVHDGHGYLISKLDAGERAGVYRFALTPGKKERALQSFCELPIVEPVTAADLSADGRLLAVLSQRTLSIFQIDGDVRKAAGASPRKFPIPPIQAEGCCFNAQGVLVIAESGEILQVKFDIPPPTTRASP